MVRTIFDRLHSAVMAPDDKKESLVETRQCLSQLRQEIKERFAREELEELVEDNPEILLRLLYSKDAKTRKNTALLIGDLKCQEYLDALFEAYEKEDTLFVKSAYLTAMQRLDSKKYLSQLQDIMTERSQIKLTDENRKHITEEMRELSSLLLNIEGTKHHKFDGHHVPSDIVLLTHRNYIDVTMESLGKIPMLDLGTLKKMSAGIRVKEDCLEEILPIRTWQELLFLVKGMTTCEMVPEKAAEKVIKADLITFLEKRHAGRAPFTFRVELKCDMGLDKKSAFAKKLGSLIEQGTNRKLINSTSNYEVELRFIENKEHAFNIMVKLYTIPDNRFEYRLEVEPSSIKPVNAALLVAIAEPYMAEDAQVLDPFCGVGTMLIERQKMMPANTSYGIDIMEEAILKARKNTEAAGQIAHYINKDFFHFVHKYLFDEIFTNMPFAIGRKTQEEIFDIYDNFFRIARTYLKPDGRIICYSHDKEFVQRLMKKYDYKILREWPINVREKTYLYVIK